MIGDPPVLGVVIAFQAIVIDDFDEDSNVGWFGALGIEPHT